MNELLYSPEAEQDCIGGFLFFPGWVRDPDFDPQLDPEDFHSFSCREIFKVMLKLNYRHLLFWGEPEVREELIRTGMLDEIGGYEYLHKLAARAYDRAQVDRHAHEPNNFAPIVKDYSLRREQIKKATALATEAFDPSIIFFKAKP